MKVNGKDDIPYTMDNKKCSKPPTSISNDMQHRGCFYHWSRGLWIVMRLSHIHSITPIKKILITPKHLGILDTISTNRKIRFNQLILAQYPFCDTHLNNTLAILGIIFRFGLETKKNETRGVRWPIWKQQWIIYLWNIGNSQACHRL